MQGRGREIEAALQERRRRLADQRRVRGRLIQQRLQHGLGHLLALDLDGHLRPGGFQGAVVNVDAELDRPRPRPVASRALRRLLDGEGGQGRAPGCVLDRLEPEHGDHPRAVQQLRSRRRSCGPSRRASPARGSCRTPRRPAALRPGPRAASSADGAPRPPPGAALDRGRGARLPPGAAVERWRGARPPRERRPVGGGGSPPSGGATAGKRCRRDGAAGAVPAAPCGSAGCCAALRAAPPPARGSRPSAPAPRAPVPVRSSPAHRAARPSWALGA